MAWSPRRRSREWRHVRHLRVNHVGGDWRRGGGVGHRLQAQQLLGRGQAGAHRHFFAGPRSAKAELTRGAVIRSIAKIHEFADRNVMWASATVFPIDSRVSARGGQGATSPLHSRYRLTVRAKRFARHPLQC